MELFAKIVIIFQPLTVFRKSSILDIWQGFKCAAEVSTNNLAVNNLPVTTVLTKSKCHKQVFVDNKNLLLAT